MMVPCSGRLNVSPENVVIWISNSLTINQLIVSARVVGGTLIAALKVEVETLRGIEDSVRRFRQDKEELRALVAGAFLNAPIEQEALSTLNRGSLTINPLT